MQRDKQQLDNESIRMGDPGTPDVIAYNLAEPDDMEVEHTCPLGQHWDSAEKKCVDN